MVDTESFFWHYALESSLFSSSIQRISLFPLDLTVPMDTEETVSGSHSIGINQNHHNKPT